MNLIIALLLLACFLVLCVFVYHDISEECRYQAELAEYERKAKRKASVPRAVNREVPQTTKGTGSS